MAEDIGGDPCLRIRAEVDGQNFYILVGTTFISASFAYENRPEQERLRQIVETICETATAGLRRIHGVTEVD